MSKTDTLNLNILETRVLWAISKNPLHGYALLKELNKSSVRRITNGTLYPILQKMLKARLIAVKTTGNREKKVYAVSKKGRKLLGIACVEFCKTFGEIFSSFVCKKCGSGIKMKIEKVKD